MASGGATVDRLREFLRELPADSRSSLIAELERKMMHGERIAGADLVLAELRRLFRESRQSAPRYGNAARIFYKPVEPFLVDDAAARQHPGRISRTALDLLWGWIRRDLLPEPTQQFTDAIGEVLLANDNMRAEALARSFQDRVAAALEPAFERGTAEQRRLLAQIGTPHAQDDALNLMRVLQLRDPLAMLADHLPGHITNLSDTRLAETRGLLAAAADRSPQIAPYALIVVMRRLAAPWQMIRLVPKPARGRAAEGDDVAIRIVMAELARLIDELRSDLQGGGIATVSLLQQIHEAARGLRVELDPAPDSTQGRELAALRTQISGMLQAEIESLPGRVRRLLRARPSAEIRAHSTLDPGDLTRTEALIGLVGACRQFAGELALNEMTQRSYSELQHYLDDATGVLLDALRHAGEADRSFRQSQADAAIRFCRQVFGPDYAAMLTRAAELAGQQDRKETQPAGA